MFGASLLSYFLGYFLGYSLAYLLGYLLANLPVYSLDDLPTHDNSSPRS